MKNYLKFSSVQETPKDRMEGVSKSCVHCMINRKTFRRTPELSIYVQKMNLNKINNHVLWRFFLPIFVNFASIERK